MVLDVHRIFSKCQHYVFPLVLVAYETQYNSNNSLELYSNSNSVEIRGFLKNKCTFFIGNSIFHLSLDLRMKFRETSQKVALVLK